MNYRFEYMGNPEYVQVHLSKRLTEMKYLSETTMDYRAEEVSDRERTLMALLSGVEGVGGGIVGTSIHPYSVSAPVGAAFEREEVMENILKALVEFLKVYGEIQEKEELKRLPDIRNDIQQMKCPECQAIQDAEMKQLYKDMDF